MVDKHNEPAKSKPPRKRRGWLSRLWRLAWVGLVLLIGAVLWFNGPGVRWLGPKIAGHFLEKAGFDGELRIEGTLFGGLELHDVALRSEGALGYVKVDRLETEYRLSEIIQGKLRGLAGENIDIDLRLIETEKEDKEPVDFAELGQSLNQLRELVVPVDIDLQNMNLLVSENDERIVELTGCGLQHRAGDDEIDLVLGDVTDALGRTLEPQSTRIEWAENELRLETLSLLPGVGIEGLNVQLPENGEVALQGSIRLEDARFKLDVGAGIKDARLDLVQGHLDLPGLADGLGLELPLKGQVNALALQMRGFYPDWRQSQGRSDLSLSEVSYDDWHAPKLDLGITLHNGGKVEAELAGESLNTPFAIEAMTSLSQPGTEDEVMEIGRIDGALRIEQVDPLLGALRQKFDWQVDVANFPESELSGNWALDLADGFQSVDAQLSLDAKNPEVSPIRLDASYSTDELVVRALEVEGTTISGSYDFTASGYRARAELADFRTAVLEPWLGGLEIELPVSAVASGIWQGEGNFEKPSHQGSLTDFATVVQRKDEPEISATGGLTYQWPASVKLDNWQLTSGVQQIEWDAVLEDNFLNLEKLTWRDGDEVMASGSGQLPIPRDFSQLKAFIAGDTREMDFAIETSVIPLAKLRPWVEGMDGVGGQATGSMSINLGGSLADPEVRANLELRDVQSPAQPDLPGIDLTAAIEAQDQVATISAEIIAEDFPPATFEAKMAFLPKQWVEEPDTLMAEKIAGKLQLPKLELSRFEALIPKVKQSAGAITGFAEISGTMGSPEVVANLKLSEGRLEMAPSALPDFNGVNFDISANARQITLDGGIDDLSGGNLAINGVLALSANDEEGIGKLEVSIRGQGLPVARNESLIVRANSDLAIEGPVESARIRGEVGIIDSMFYQDIELIPIGKPVIEPTPAALPAMNAPTNIGTQVPAFFRNWSANVLLKTIDPILIRGNLGKGKVTANLRVSGKLGNPIPNGTVKLENTTVRLPFTTLNARDSTLSFNANTGFDPVIEFRGDATIRPYQVEIYVYGNVSEPELVLVSQPPLPAEEIMTLLATGTTTAGLEDSAQASARATQLLLEEFRRGRFLFGKQLRPVLSLLDDVDFSIAEQDPYTSNTFNSASLKLNESWSVSAGVDAEGDQRMMATWRFNFK